MTGVELPSGLAAALANDLASARAQMHASLVTLKDVYGITGSFVFARSGHLVARELPPMFDDAALSEASSRLTRLQETFASVGNKLEVAVLRYREHKVYVKTLPAGALCIISNGGVNMPALRMAASLVGRRIAPVLDQVADDPALARAVPAAAAAPAAPASPAEKRPPPLAPPGMRRFRGRTVE
jgi:predicted regulator of Ras-like GTPase activity (Roadblock/LC7/MglB family)